MMLVWAIISFFDAGKKFDYNTVLIIVGFILFSILPPIILKMCMTKLSDECITVTGVSIIENGGEGFIGTYILPYLSNIVTDEWYLLMIGVMVLLTIIMWINNSYCFNPILSLFRYKFYSIQNSKNVTLILLSRRVIKDPATIKSVYNITEYLVLDGGGN